MSAQQSPRPAPAMKNWGRITAERRRELIAQGELVSNAPLRERCEWLMENDPDFSLRDVCVRMAEQGFPSFAKFKETRSGQRVPSSGDTTHVLRLLGMRDLSPSRMRNGRVWVPKTRTSWIRYDVAVALCRALEMDPVDAGV